MPQVLCRSDELVGSICALCAAYAPAADPDTFGVGAERGYANGQVAAVRRAGSKGAGQEGEEVVSLTVALQTLSVWMAGRR